MFVDSDLDIRSTSRSRSPARRARPGAPGGRHYLYVFVFAAAPYDVAITSGSRAPIRESCGGSTRAGQVRGFARILRGRSHDHQNHVLPAPDAFAYSDVLDAFIIANNDEIIFRVRKRVASRSGKASRDDGGNGIPVFLEQLGVALRLADETDRIDHEEIRKSAATYGDELLKSGLDIEEVVHAYGDVCQTLTELAIETDAPIPTEEFRVMNLCLDDAIAQAVTQFSQHRGLEGERTATTDAVAHEMLALLASARTSFEIIQRGQVAPRGATAQILERSLASLTTAVEGMLAQESLVGDAEGPSAAPQ